MATIEFWKGIIEEAEERDRTWVRLLPFRSVFREEWVEMANSWGSRPTSNLSVSRRGGGKPKEQSIIDLGHLFYRATRDDRVDDAKRVLRLIEKRQEN